jgi:formamidopyrimidine-DNA glycosylase
MGKQLCIRFDDALSMVIHLMIAGRLHWTPKPPSMKPRNNLAAWDFDDGSLLLTESSKKKRAAVRLIGGEKALAELDRGGLDVQTISFGAFYRRLSECRHTLKRALTDQRVFGGIGNAYSDEILHRAKLSPFKRAGQLDKDDGRVLYAATLSVLQEWTERLRAENNGKFPAKVTAFHEEMAVHGKFREPCPECGAPVQRIVYAENESNYCPGCQTGGKILADRALSKLLHDDWPKSLDELEDHPLGLG